MTQFTSNVPISKEGWEDDFVIPTQFSQRTMTALATGTMTSSARAEIVQMTAGKMLNMCQYPTRDQYNVIARKIVKELLHGRGDTFGTGHVSST